MEQPINRSLDKVEDKLHYNPKDEDGEKENFYNCSKKMKLFEALERDFLFNDGSKEPKDQNNSILHEYFNTDAVESEDIPIKSLPVEVKKSILDLEKNENVTQEDVIHEDNNMEESQLKTNKKSAGSNNQEKYETKGKINNEHSSEELKTSDPVTNENSKDDEVFQKDQVNGTLEKTNRDVSKSKSEEPISITVENSSGRRKARNRHVLEDEEEEDDEEEEEDDDEDITSESEESDYENELQDKSDNKNEDKNSDKEEDKGSNDNNEKEDKAPSLHEIRRQNRMKLMSQVSNLLALANSKISKVSEKVEVEKPRLTPNPRKRKRSDDMDVSTRALIREITPLRRSSRQVERKYYSEGVHDPELLLLLKKLENYVRLNAEFKPSQDETCYEEDFRGFKMDDAKRNMYLERSKKRRLYRRVQNRSHRSVAVPTLDVSEVTDDVLRNVVTCVSAKVYSQNGSTCHQCRQKTTDTKTFCRSGTCTGVRGQFCGVCLLNRYGEDIVKALLDEQWACPPCRDICNCSICRNRKGLAPTGILTPLALHKGYESVKDYLQEEEKNLNFIEYDI